MRIGILTLMHGYNYGGMLQCFSLQRALEQLGHKVEIIDFHPTPGWRKARKLGGVLGPLGDRLMVDGLSSYKYGKAVHNPFQDFRRNQLNLSKPCNSEGDLKSIMHDYDAMVVGSDQVWNLDWAIDEYFFSFADDYKGLLVSYAACFGHVSHGTSGLDKIGDWLNRFSSISVRNNMSAKLVKEACGRETDVVADPTLLVDLSDLNAPVELPCKEYILHYGLVQERYDSGVSFFREYADRKGLPIVGIQSDVLQPWDMSDCDHLVVNPSVEQWLWLFANASAVLTDSFHGTLFSIKNKVPFINYIGSAMSSERVAYVAERYNLSAGYRSPTDEEDPNAILDFEDILGKVDQHKTASLEFLIQQFGKKG